MKLFCKIPKNTFIVSENQIKSIIAENNKQKQLDVILKNNPADDVHFVNSAKVVPVNDIAWLDQGQGQYAPLHESKTVIVNASQIKQLHEAMNNTFSFEELNNIKSFPKRVAYCKQHMGNPIGNGSSRMVFQIDDEKVLKLAKNQKGIAQNDVEADWGAQNYGVLPNLYEEANDDTYIVTEYVLPAKPQDFQVCLGMSFEDFCNFVKKCFKSYASSRQSFGVSSNINDDKFSEILENNEWLDQFYTYLSDYQPPLGDLLRIANYGLCKRDGKPEIVLLDSGLSQQVWDDYYQR